MLQMHSQLSEIIYNLLPGIEYWRKSDILLRNLHMDGTAADWFNVRMLNQVSTEPAFKL